MKFIKLYVRNVRDRIHRLIAMSEILKSEIQKAQKQER